jgi:hypothetical protein
MSRCLRLVFVIMAVTSFSPVHVFAGQVPAPGVIACANPFGRDSTRSDLVRAFGAANVVDQEVEGHGGVSWYGTVIYPKDPRRRLEILWGDEVNRRLLASVRILYKSRWMGWRNMRIGMPLEEVENLNGKPFKLLTEFESDDGGVTTGWQGGAMDGIPGGCQLFVRFEPAKDAPVDTLEELIGEFVSSNPKVRSLRLRISEIYTSYQK